MKPIEVSREVAAPAGVIWGVVCDLDAAPELLSGMTSLERLGGPEFGVGTRWRETRVMFGKEASEEIELTVIDPGVSYRTEARSHGMHYISVVSVAAAGDGSGRLTIGFDAEPLGLASRILGNTVGLLFRGPTRKALQTDLDELAAAAEARAAAP